jgi:hypothetical protein
VIFLKDGLIVHTYRPEEQSSLPERLSAIMEIMQEMEQ